MRQAAHAQVLDFSTCRTARLAISDWVGRSNARTGSLSIPTSSSQTLRNEVMVDFTRKDNPTSPSGRVWAENRGLARGPRRLHRNLANWKEVALLAIAQADVLQAPLIHPAQISKRQVGVCHGFASVERDFRGNVGLAIGIFEQLAQLHGDTLGRSPCVGAPSLAS